MQAIHINDRVYHVRRDGLLDAGSNAGPIYACSNSPATDLERRLVGLSGGGLIGLALSFLVRFGPVIPIRCNAPQSLL